MFDPARIAWHWSGRALSFHLIRRSPASLVLAALSLLVHVEQVIGRVVGVADGDAVTVLDAQNQMAFIAICSGSSSPPMG